MLVREKKTLQMCFNKFGKLAERVKNRRACIVHIEDWRVLFSLTAVFIHLLDGARGPSSDGDGECRFG